MQNISEHIGEIRKYLLGNLTGENTAEIEQRLLNDDQFFEELLICENELVDEYFAGRLTEDEKRRFETHFLVAPERQARFRFGRVFNQYLESHESTNTAFEKSRDLGHSFPGRLADAIKSSPGVYWLFQRPLVTASLSVVILFLACGAYWFWAQKGGGLQTSQQVVSVTLMPGGVRSGGATQRVEIKPDVGTLQLELGLVTVDFSAYSVELLTEGETVKIFKGLKPISKDGQHHIVVSMNPPASGDYQLKLRGVSSSGRLEVLNSYNFRVIRP